MSRNLATKEITGNFNKSLADLYKLSQTPSSKVPAKPSVSWKESRARILSNPEVEKEVKEIEPEFEIIEQIIKARIEQNITQKELAEMIGTRQSNISRLERGDYNPSLQFLKKIAKALGKELHVSFN